LHFGDADADPRARELGQQLGFRALHTDGGGAGARLTKSYAQRAGTFQQLDELVDSGGAPVAIVGAAGRGKTALLANWLRHHRERRPKVAVLQYFVEASAEGARWAWVVRQLLYQLSEVLDVHVDVPEKSEDLRSALAEALRDAAAKGPYVLVLDGLDRLQDIDGARELLWLPSELPHELRLVASMRPGTAASAATEREWTTLALTSLNESECQQICRDYLGHYAKQLSDAQLKRITSAKLCREPLFLRTTLEELRVHGNPRSLDDRIEQCLSARSIPELFEMVLERLDRDFESEHPRLAGEALSLLACSRQGLSEAELLDLLGSATAPLPQRIWAPLQAAASAVISDGPVGLTLSNEYIAQSVRTRYLPTQEHQQRTHARLAEYFASQELGPNQIDELPWQLLCSRQLRKLAHVLARLDFLEAAWQANRHNVNMCWALIEAQFPLQALTSYRDVIDDPGDPDHVDYVGTVASVLHARGHFREALDLHREAGARALQTDHLRNARISLDMRAEILRRTRPYRALYLLREAERLCRKHGDEDGLQTELGNQGMVLASLRSLREALALTDEKLAICRRTRNVASLAIALSQKAGLMIELGRGSPKQHLALVREAVACARKANDLGALGSAVGNLAILMGDAGQYEQAARYFAEQARLYTMLGDPAGLQRCHHNQQAALLKRVRRSGREKWIVGTGLLTAGGIALGVWNAWLWILGGPLALLGGVALFFLLAPNWIERVMFGGRENEYRAPEDPSEPCPCRSGERFGDCCGAPVWEVA
jgi:tetratricopeptide (TPR) repeat protein